MENFKKQNIKEAIRYEAEKFIMGNALKIMIMEFQYVFLSAKQHDKEKTKNMKKINKNANTFRSYAFMFNIKKRLWFPKIAFQITINKVFKSRLHEKLSGNFKDH